MSKEIEDLVHQLQEFAQERDWSQFHSPKNLAMALSAEAGELLAHFQWVTEDESNNLTKRKLEEVGFEIADIFLYLLMLSDKLGLDPIELSQRKIMINKDKYPKDKAFGSSKKYTELD